MADRLLTQSQAADLLAVSHSTLSNWRARRQGPPYVVLTEDGASLFARHAAVRYRASDLIAWVDARATAAEAIEAPRHRDRSPRPLTDAEWAAVEAVPRPSRPTRSIAPRVLLDAVLWAATRGEWPPERPAHEWHRRAKESLPWIREAFVALAGFPGFPYLLAVQTSVMRATRSTRVKPNSVCLEARAIGPEEMRKRRQIKRTLPPIGTLK